MQHKPAIESLRAVTDIFEKATRDKGLSTILYEDPDAVEDQDYEMVKLITQKLQEEPGYPIP